MRALILVVIFFAVFWGSSLPTVAVTFDWAVIRNPGNAPDNTGFGSVDYVYRISQYEVTVAQYSEFLNAVATSDPYQLYEGSIMDDIGIVRNGSPGTYTYAVKPPARGQGAAGTDYVYATKPVSFVSWLSTLRFTNWMHNGQGNGDTESGAYTLLGGSKIPSNLDDIARNPGATVFLPSEDEWYKAAYHKNDGITGNYWDYPTGTDETPNENPPSQDTGNSVNSTFAGEGLADVDAYSLSASPYGTISQGGNLSEWVESTSGGSRTTTVLRAGDFLNCNAECSATDFRRFFGPATGNFISGFRVASVVPEPTTCALALAAALCLVVRGRR